MRLPAPSRPRLSLALVLAALLVGAGIAPSAGASALARTTWTVAADERLELLAQADAGASADAAPEVAPPPAAAGPSPAGAALRSLLVPGWGQLATGHKTQAGIFLGLEAGSWGSWITFRRQGSLREQSYLETARIYAGIDLAGQGDAMRRRVGQWQSNEVYNQYVVRREAAFFIEDPAEREAYIAANSLGGSESWSWTLFEDFLRYREQRLSSESAYHNAEFVVGFAIVNRLVSAVMAARQAATLRRDASAALEAPTPEPGRPQGRFAWGVGPGARGPIEGRVGWIVTF